MTKVIELQKSMEEMTSRHEEMCKSSELMCAENEVLNERVDALHSSVVVLQGEKDEVEGKWIAATNENEDIARDNRLLLEKVNALEAEKNNLINENEISVSTIDDMQVSMDEMKSSYEEICTKPDLKHILTSY